MTDELMTLLVKQPDKESAWEVYRLYEKANPDNEINISTLYARFVRHCTDLRLQGNEYNWNNFIDSITK